MKHHITADSWVELEHVENRHSIVKLHIQGQCMFSREFIFADNAQVVYEDIIVRIKQMLFEYLVENA